MNLHVPDRKSILHAAGLLATALSAHAVTDSLSLAWFLQIRCVRADLVTPVELRRYTWVLLPHKQRMAVAGWLLDDRTHTFTVVADDGTPQVPAISLCCQGAVKVARLPCC